MEGFPLPGLAVGGLVTGMTGLSSADSAARETRLALPKRVASRLGGNLKFKKENTLIACRSKIARARTSMQERRNPYIHDC